MGTNFIMHSPSQRWQPQVICMATETTETPVILYETLAPLGDDYDDQSLGLPAYSLPLNASDLEATGDEITGVVAPVSLSVDVVTSSPSVVSDSVGENCRGGIDQTPALSVIEGKENGEASAVLDLEEEIFTSPRSAEEHKVVSRCNLDTFENEEFEAGILEGRSRWDDEEFGFLSLESEIPVHRDQEQLQMPDEQTLLHALIKAPKEAPPWARTRTTHGTWFRSPFLQLHQEIVDFCNFVTPTEKEQKIRDDAVQRVREVVLSIWPSCQVKVFGSFATGLYLPTSDIDVVILESGCQAPQDGLKALAKALNRKSLVKNLQVIGKARVPIVKFVEAESNIPFDISFDVPNGPEAAEFIKDAVVNLPPLKPLCMVLKIFLQQRELNEVYTGGIGSYALLVMLLTHLQTHPSRKSFDSWGKPCPLESNLGILLVDFFDFYGRALNVRDVGISCRSGGRFYCKRSRGFADNGRPYLLSVEDPQKPDNDIGKNSYNVLKVRSAFVLAHRLLTKLEVEDIPEHVGLLGRIVRMDNQLIRREVVPTELPPRLHSGRNMPGNPSSGISNEKEALTPGVTDRLRWDQDEEFPRGGEEEKLSRKRKRAKDRAEKFVLKDDPVRIHKRKRAEVSEVDTNPGASSVRFKKSKLRKSLETTDPSSTNRESQNPVRQRPGPVENRVEKGKRSKQRKSSKRDNLSLEADVEVQSPHLNRSSKRSKRYQKEDSHEEGEITLEDDATIGNAGNARGYSSGNDVTLGGGNGHNKHKRWFSESGKSKNRQNREQKGVFVDKGLRTQEVTNDGGRLSRKVMVTNAHKKVTYS